MASRSNHDLSRRHFLKNTSAIAAGLTFHPFKATAKEEKIAAPAKSQSPAASLPQPAWVDGPRVGSGSISATPSPIDFFDTPRVAEASGHVSRFNFSQRLLHCSTFADPCPAPVRLRKLGEYTAARTLAGATPGGYDLAHDGQRSSTTPSRLLALGLARGVWGQSSPEGPGGPARCGLGHRGSRFP